MGVEYRLWGLPLRLNSARASTDNNIPAGQAVPSLRNDVNLRAARPGLTPSHAVPFDITRPSCRRRAAAF